MSRLIIVSNRLPLSLVKKNKEIQINYSVGGLATGVGSVHKSGKSIWVGWPGTIEDSLPSENKNKIKYFFEKERYVPIFLDSKEVEYYYRGFCNETIWPLFHYFTSFPKYNSAFWEIYKIVNKKFCDAILNVARPDDTIWIHDYHLMMLPKMVREFFPKAKIGFFLHIPFPSYEIFRLLPWRKEILEGLLGSDLVGFHTYDYAGHFLTSVRRILGHEHSFGEIFTDERIVKVDLFPMGINYERFEKTAKNSSVEKERANIVEKIGKTNLILSFDRLDYTKGIPLRLHAFDRLLEKKPSYREKVTLILVSVPSRVNVQKYKLLKREIDELVGNINGKYGTTNWTPVHYFYRILPFEMLVALYSAADVALVTPLRDGMNLMAKEFVATKITGQGVLILSEMSGAAQELGEALIVNPNDEIQVIEAIETALVMSKDEQQKRNFEMQKRLKRYGIMRWVHDFLDCLEGTQVEQHKRNLRMVANIQKKLVRNYHNSKNRLFLLDYDGTLVPFTEKPEKATPSEDVINIVKALSSSPSNEVVIISGRDKDTLNQWFKSFDVGMIAEHGVWIKERGSNWKTIKSLSDEWKMDLRSILEIYTDRTPGSFIEEKTYSLVWHYRKTEPNLADVRAKELKEILLNLTSNLSVGVFEGNNILEIKNTVINKGWAAKNWLSKKRWDFIMALGDDRTDEDLFEVLPKRAYSIKVGLGPSKARYNVMSQKEVLSLLNNFT